MFSCAQRVRTVAPRRIDRMQPRAATKGLSVIAKPLRETSGALPVRRPDEPRASWQAPSLRVLRVALRRRELCRKTRLAKHAQAHLLVGACVIPRNNVQVDRPSNTLDAGLACRPSGLPLSAVHDSLRRLFFAASPPVSPAAAACQTILDPSLLP